MGRDAQELARLEVDAHLDGEARIAGQAFVRRHWRSLLAGHARSPKTCLRRRGSVPAVLLTITTTGKVTLLVVAGIFIAWALITAIWIPKRNPDFPGTLTVFVLVSAALFAAQMGAVYWVTGTQEVETEEAAPGAGETPPAETTPAETTPAETTPAETTPAETTPAETTPAETTPRTPRRPPRPAAMVTRRPARRSSRRPDVSPATRLPMPARPGTSARTSTKRSRPRTSSSPE